MISMTFLAEDSDHGASLWVSRRPDCLDRFALPSMVFVSTTMDLVTNLYTVDLCFCHYMELNYDGYS